MNSRRLRERCFDAVVAARGNVFLVYDNCEDKHTATVPCYTKVNNNSVVISNKKDNRVRGTRPYVIISNNGMTTVSNCVLACPIRTDHRNSSIGSVINSGIKGVPFYNMAKDLCIVDTQVVVTLNLSQVCDAMYLYSLPATVMDLIDNDIDFHRYGSDNVDDILKDVTIYHYDENGIIRYYDKPDNTSNRSKVIFSNKGQTETTTATNSNPTFMKRSENVVDKLPEDLITVRHQKVAEVANVLIDEKDKHEKVKLVSTRGRVPFWGDFTIAQFKLMLIERRYLNIDEFCKKYNIKESTAVTIKYSSLRLKISNSDFIDEMKLKCK